MNAIHHAMCHCKLSFSGSQHKGLLPDNGSMPRKEKLQPRSPTQKTMLWVDAQLFVPYTCCAEIYHK